MAKNKTLFVCQSCGYENYRWLGKCPECGNWNTFSEEIIPSSKKEIRQASASSESVPLSQIELKSEHRLKSGIGEFDRVLGGGIVPGSVILIGGAPGMGKSTLLLNVCGRFTDQGKSVLYVSGEESLQQIKLRADRIQVNSELFRLAAENDIDKIIPLIQSTHPDLVVIDSIQTVYFQDLESVPGNISQVRYCGYHLTAAAKNLNIPVIMVGHVTKEGSLAGPRVLEHLVDCLMFLEGDGYYQNRMLRTLKNRFGSTNEVGIFEMTSMGISEVENPSAYLISQKRNDTSGTVITAAVEGTRPLMVEIQALVTQTNFGIPQRTATGLDHRRLNMLLAVLEKKLGLKFGNQDVFVNAAGGIKLHEPAADLALTVAMVSSLKEHPVPSDTALIGEVGLAGEVRNIPQAEKRIMEADRLGFKTIICSKISKNIPAPRHGIKIQYVQSVEEAMEEIFKS